MPAFIRTVSFDADDTLWDFLPVMRRALDHVLEHMRAIGLTGSESLDAERMIAIRDEVAAEPASATLRLEEIRERAFARTLDLLGHPDPAMARELNALYLRHRFADVRPYDDVLPALDALGPGRTLGIVSNGNSDPEKCGLPGRFAFTVFAQDYGIRKPDPRLFLVAAEKAGCSPREMVHVGDSLETDVAGAASAGMCSVWLNREGRRVSGGIKPDGEIRSLLELPDVVARLSSRRTGAKA